MEISIRVCDVCKDPSRVVTRYTVAADDNSGTTDRCSEHGAEFARVVASKAKEEAPARPARKAAAPSFRSESAAPAAPRRAARGGRQKVVTIDEIEKAKRQR